MAAVTGWYTEEIQQMMFGFGDCRRPLLESAKLIEEIVHEQLVHILIKANELCIIRQSKSIGIEEILFQMRKDKVKLQRLLKYLVLKDLKGTLVKKSVDADESYELDLKLQSACKTRKKLCREFLDKIDNTGELLSVFSEEIDDEVDLERKQRADVASSSLDMANYFAYAEARRCNFIRKFRMNHFRDWVMKDLQIEFKPNQLGLEALHYLAYETVAQVVDLCLLIKREAQAQDQMDKLLAPGFVNSDFPCVRTFHAFKGIKSDGEASGQKLLEGSPPSPSSGSSLVRNKGVKRKKPNEPATLMKLQRANAITPLEIHEAMRRYYSHVFGPAKPFSNSVVAGYRKPLSC